MDKSQAEAIAQVILQPDPAREKIQRRKAREAWWLAERRKVALLVLVGFAIGAAVGLQLGQRFSVGGLWGGMAGAVVGWIWIGLRSRRHAP